MDYLLDELTRLKALPTTNRAPIASALAHWLLRIQVADLDRMIRLRDR
jgi:hypothetical protein